GRRITDKLDEELLDSIPLQFFTDVGGLKIGTESFCDRELGRLGKPYDFARIRKLALGLSRRGIRQDHYMILCNRRTTLDDLLENLEAITALRWSAGRGFSVLEPSWLINLFPTALYRACQVRGTELEQPTAGVLRQEGYDELDYPLVLPESPERPEVFDVVRRFPAGMHFGAAGSPDWTFDGIYDPDDVDYLRVFAFVRRALVERRDVSRDEGEIFRIEEALASHLGGDRWLPSGLLTRVAPALDLDASVVDGASRLTGYLETLLAGCKDELGGHCRVESAAEGALLEVTIDGTSVDFLVQRYAPGAACAFSTPNLAFIVRTPMDSEQERRLKGGIIEKVQKVVSRHDTHELE
ncbi:MAG: hypothetical protein JRG91_16130, partial [Deltaproteobacteria bacterium]|nr:hypothetical protein [Deltaproteobacteria bacterium]